ncbi:SMP-30/gluconolactonase/LRE family protein [Paraburkholderia sp. CNPSo 3076]|uniref:SMP-30/gluconolactonase/LRE family protein n=1 Tax=Paraburkholderia sp. CNPSo 3076 TaxID=2940936 RepID=UPI002254C3BE|nr:SMP-30/gluconolactonase/LRE family protein [Paraburkholderia sp. CNPSo 3076]MCX5540437.1 SMP-30/gluconolactonase/LRE family protein [Paraburkholderia sp. CNPSo 3076]
MAIEIERITTITAALGECPVWDAAQASLWFIDSRKGRIYRVDPQTDASTHYDVPPPAGSFALNDDGNLIVALKEAIALLDTASGECRSLAHIEASHPNLRLNDGAAMRDGSFVVGTMHIYRENGEAPLGGIYRLQCDGALVKLDGGIGVANGPAEHPVNGRFHIADSAAKTIWSYVIESDGALGERRAFVNTEALGSAPDGCCFDAQGGLWTALVHASAIARFDEQGRMTDRIDLPLAHPASLCFGGPLLDDIYVTSITDSGRLRASGELDGALLRLRGAGYRGAPRFTCRIRAA